METMSTGPSHRASLVISEKPGSRNACIYACNIEGFARNAQKQTSSCRAVISQTVYREVGCYSDGAGEDKAFNKMLEDIEQKEIEMVFYWNDKCLEAVGGARLAKRVIEDLGAECCCAEQFNEVNS